MARSETISGEKTRTAPTPTAAKRERSGKSATAERGREALRQSGDREVEEDWKQEWNGSEGERDRKSFGIWKFGEEDGTGGSNEKGGEKRKILMIPIYWKCQPKALVCR